ncbi:maleylpyruvate isomerase family mycothiol-dependent enzyme [Streptomyces piniterrae]|uniref:Maleylpyruvate isomerase family mycothiol-dependent enzyme n=1 Tax=Streptomyces piniterrae TaxID=2571125 RepID=A0A4U0NMR1_9ACTN|nr:maleylpyruvate isomerase family mycothiol-dependent enzyme [Streptomyces piniterrae]TJZ55570.1 maleylpyruvate isomerase family mycothiol-dependent enzyme [Streptomyces piniterrae]
MSGNKDGHTGEHLGEPGNEQPSDWDRAGAGPAASPPAVHRDSIAAETARIVAMIEDANLSAPVPSCPGWTLLDLVQHIGSVQRMFSVLLRRLIQEPPRSRDVDLRIPEDASGYGEWLAASAAEAAGAFAVTDPNAAMWAWGADQHARFWVRRMLFETLVHRVDAELALGRHPAIDRVLAADGVDEFLVNLPFAAFFAPKVANLRGNGETLRFRCTDTDGDWLIRLRPDGFDVTEGPGAGSGADTGTGTGADTGTALASADATVHGAAADLLLLLYGRLNRESDAFDVSGDADLLTLWFTNSAF